MIVDSRMVVCVNVGENCPGFISMTVGMSMLRKLLAFENTVKSPYTNCNQDESNQNLTVSRDQIDRNHIFKQ